MRFKTAYGKNPRQQFETIGASLTHQSMSAECDINTIMKKYERTGILEHRNTFEGQYGDFTNGPTDYHESMNAVIEANDMFDTLPAKVRRRFHNDPGAFLEFVANPENAEELIRLGLAQKPAEEPKVDPAPSATKEAEPPLTPNPTASNPPKKGDTPAD